VTFLNLLLVVKAGENASLVVWKWVIVALGLSLIVFVDSIVALNPLLVVWEPTLVVSHTIYQLIGCGTAGWCPQLDMRKYFFPPSVEGAPIVRGTE